MKALFFEFFNEDNFNSWLFKLLLNIFLIFLKINKKITIYLKEYLFRLNINVLQKKLKTIDLSKLLKSELIKKKVKSGFIERFLK